MTSYNKKLFKEVSKKIGSEQGVYSAVRRKEEKFKAVKPEFLFYLVAAEHGIKISKYEKDEEILKKVDELLSRNTLPSKSNNTNDNQNEKQKPSEVDPFTISLSKFNLFPDLARGCKIRKPYSKEINYAILNLEDFMRKKMNLDETFHGKGLVEEARRRDFFKKKLESESQGLYFMYMSAFLWLRNGGFHKKNESDKERCFEIILFIDYLIKLFDELCKNAKPKIQTN
jgi:hypothetical protein